MLARFRRQREGISYGIPAGAPAGSSRLTFLKTPTPGAPNSEATA